MKVYAIQFADSTYLEFSNRRMFCSYGTKVKTTTDITKAKHYKSEGRTKGVLTTRKNAFEGYVSNCRNDIARIKAGGGTVSNYYYTCIDRYNGVIKLISEATVVEVDVKTPNFTKQANEEIRFQSYGTGVSTKNSQGNMYCKGCGIYFKQIPMLVFGNYSKPARICPWCMLERAELAQELLDKIPEERRENIEAERFLHRM